MKLVTYAHDGGTTWGLLLEAEAQVIDIGRLVPQVSSLEALVGGAAGTIDWLADLPNSAPPEARLTLSDVRLQAPLTRPSRNIICVGRNYHDHAQEFHKSGFDATRGPSAIPDYPIFFSKSLTSIIGPGEPIPASADWTASVDYEAELAVVIGKGGRQISKAEAFDHVFGYTIVNDVTSRTLQQQHRQWYLGKNFDGFCPMGPWLVTADEVGDVNGLTVSAQVNGESRQSAPVSDLIFDIPTLIETLSAAMTLVPGDIIATGTPAGVGIGFDPPVFLKPGDVVTIGISKLGVLENPVA